MGRLAAVFPGQGSQFVGMGRELAERWPAAAAAFAEVDAALGEPLSRLAWEGPESELRLTANTQPALLAHSLAAWRVLESAGLRVDAVAGHSLGEYSAAVAARCLGLADAARTVRRRGTLMQEAVPVGAGAMAAVIGLDDAAVQAACAEASEELGAAVVAANFNAPAQVVIAGAAAAVEAAGERCRARGARRVLPLPVSAPFHSPLMAPAREGLTPTLAELRLADLAVPLYRNVDAAPVLSAGEVRDGLVRQVDAPVLWAATMRRLWDDGFDTFVEVGAGAVLAGLIKRTLPAATTYTAGTVAQVDAAVAALVG